MSRHHVQLPPAVYIPQPKPKRIEKRRTLRLFQVRSDGSIKDADEALEVDQEMGTSPPVVANKSSSNDLAPIDGGEGKPKLKFGLLSDGTLKAMLVVQEELK